MTEAKATAKPAAKKTETEKGYTVLVSPVGAETTVPDSIKDALFDSGYKAK